MAESLTFAMGKHEAAIAADRRYFRNHMWGLQREGLWRVGFSAYAIRLMQDVYFLEWKFDAPRSVDLKEEIGFLESSKAQSGLYAPCGGRIVRFNADLLNDPSGINTDGYGEGWLFDIDSGDAETMDAAAYVDYLAANWDATQRIIKKQVLE
jgi:glycine cleavage system H protein